MRITGTSIDTTKDLRAETFKPSGPGMEASVHGRKPGKPTSQLESRGEGVGSSHLLPDSFTPALPGPMLHRGHNLERLAIGDACLVFAPGS